MDEKSAARIFKALADENRVRILRRLQAGEKCACDLLEDLHMKILCESGIVTGRKEGKWMHYSVSEAGFRELLEFLDGLDAQAEDAAGS